MERVRTRRLLNRGGREAAGGRAVRGNRYKDPLLQGFALVADPRIAEPPGASFSGRQVKPRARRPRIIAVVEESQ